MLDFDTLKSMWAHQQYDPKPAKDWREGPRQGHYTCFAPGCDGAIMSTNAKVPNHYTAFTCWYCESDEHTKPRPFVREEKTDE